MKKLISVFLSICICLCLFTPVCFADDSAYNHTHNWVKEKIHSYSLEYNGVAFGIDVFKCSECALYLHTLKFLGYEVPVIRASPDTALGSEAAAMCAQAMVAVFGKEWYATKFEAGGGSASPGGVGRNPSGYAGEGTPNISPSGSLYMVATPYFVLTEDRFFSWKTVKTDTFSNSYLFCNPKGIVHGERVVSAFGTSMFTCHGAWKITAPYDGIYYINIMDSEQDLGYCNMYAIETSKSKSYNFTSGHTTNPQNKYFRKVYAKKGETVYWFTGGDSNGSIYSSKLNYCEYSINPLIISYEPDTSTIVNQTNITINNNTFNGNIYVDNSNKLTYIYPQYTVNNETKISNNPIIYNEETKQYYTYDQTTNNYYYITYNAPTPTPTPSPSPDPGGSTPDPDKPSPTPTPGGSDSSDGGSGINPFKWLADLLKDIVEGIFKAVWKLTTSIFGFLIWLVGLLGNVLPFLPSEGLAALSAAAIIITVIRIIKFILGR